MEITFKLVAIICLIMFFISEFMFFKYYILRKCNSIRLWTIFSILLTTVGTYIIATFYINVVDTFDLNVINWFSTNGNLRIPNSVHKRFLSYEH